MKIESEVLHQNNSEQRKISAMERRISVIIPNYNMSRTIGKCLEAILSSDYKNYEAIVVDDHSIDNSVEIIETFSCKLIRLQHHVGTSKARNIGASMSTGDYLFFIDADCLLREDTLHIINRKLSVTPSDYVIGGTYTKIPYDKTFFSMFQSLFVHYSETKNSENPDYIAAHAMIISKNHFTESGGFPENFLPILEDVEFSHRLRAAGFKLVMYAEIQVSHIFDFSLAGSLRNAFKKSSYWCMYSLRNKDVLVDSGCASAELKTNVTSFALVMCCLIFFLIWQRPVFLVVLAVALLVNGMLNRGIFKIFYDSGGSRFAVYAILYYLFIYPVPVGLGAITGTIKNFFTWQEKR